MAVGVLGIAYGFYSAPSNEAEAKEMMASHADHHGEAHAAEAGHDAAHSEAEDAEHVEHAFHQMANRPWSAFMVPMLFFFFISVGALVFYAIQNVSQAGWSPLLFRVMQGISNYMLPGAIIVFFFMLLSTFHLNHIYVWMDADTVANDEVIQEKSAYLDITFFIIRSVIILGAWLFFRHKLVSNCVKQDEELNLSLYKKNLKLSIGFLLHAVPPQ
jgi:hypothetical protein